MEKNIDNNLPNGKTSDAASVLRQPSCPSRGKMPAGQKGVVGEEYGRVVRPYQFAYPDRVAILKENARKNRLVPTDADSFVGISA